MFKFSFNMVKQLCGIDITSQELLNILALQGFEVDEVTEKNGDIVVNIEVKANRPDMLSHLGVAREICAFKGIKAPQTPKIETQTIESSFPVKVDVDESTCSRFCLLEISHIDNNAPTPKEITSFLENLGINCINAVVDITNYVMLKYGQPMHAYDKDRISGNILTVKKSESEKSILTLGEIEAKIQVNDIVISDESDVLCVAGVIGTDKCSVKHDTQNILLESACFDPVSVRLTSRRLKISTPSSFRFERGIDESCCMDVLLVCADLINKVCTGTTKKSVFDFYPNPKIDKIINIRTTRVNKLIGSEISQQDIISLLTKYGFKSKILSNDNIEVCVPKYRLDVNLEADIIEEIARAYGYDNISPVMPRVHSNYCKNKVWDNMDILRQLMVGLGFCEVMNYSFIPYNFAQILNLEKDHRLYSELILQNPINRDYAVMRPTLVYSMLQALAYNYSVNNTNLALFEVGRAYFKDERSETQAREVNMLGFITSGIRLQRGWGIEKDVKYSYYDMLNYLNIIFDRFGGDFDLKSSVYPFGKNAYDIFYKSELIGFIAEIDTKSVRKIKNFKLVKDGVFYCEIDIEKLEEKPKKLKFESKYPPLVRLYNLVLNKNVKSSQVQEIIYNSSPLVLQVKVKDIYKDSKMPENQHALLYEVKFCSADFTVTAQQIQEIETDFLQQLSQVLGVSLKN